MTSFFVAGLPVTEGSIKNVGRRRNGSAILRHDRAEELERWRAIVALAAREAEVPFRQKGVPVVLDLHFALPRPRSHFAKGGLHLKKSAPLVPTTVPDADKLLRAVGDALSGIAYQDDAQVTDGITRKRYAALHSPPGVFVEIRDFEGIP